MRVSNHGPGRGRVGNNAEYVRAGAMSRPSPDSGRCGATVGDGLVPSRAEAAAVPGGGRGQAPPLPALADTIRRQANFCHGREQSRMSLAQPVARHSR